MGVLHGDMRFQVCVVYMQTANYPKIYERI